MLGPRQHRKRAIGSQLPRIRAAFQRLTDRKGAPVKRRLERFTCEMIAGRMRKGGVRPNIVITCRRQQQPKQPRELS